MTQTSPNLQNISDKDLIDSLLMAEEDKASADRAAKQLKDELLHRRKQEIDLLLKAKSEPFGSLHVEMAQREINIDVRKKVAWDQKKLTDVAAQIVADGGKVSDYLDVEYSIPESRWKAWGENIRPFFEPARSVSLQGMTVKVGKAFS